MEEARAAELNKLKSASPPAPEEPRVLSFQELKDLIESGRVDQIPNNKIIPEKFTVCVRGQKSGLEILTGSSLQEEPPSQSTATIRKKPWEIDTNPEPQST